MIAVIFSPDNIGYSAGAHIRLKRQPLRMSRILTKRVTQEVTVNDQEVLGAAGLIIMSVRRTKC